MLDLLIVIIYFLFILVLGIKSGLKVKGLKEYSVAKDTYTPFVMGAAIFATLVGGGSTMGVSEKVFDSGLVFLVACFGFVVRDLITATFIVPKFNQYNDCLTVGDIMHRYYGKTGKVIVGIAGTLQGIVFLGMQVAAIGHLTNYFLQLPYAVGVMIGVGIVIIYSSIGGMRAVTITDMIQFSVLIVAIPLTFAIGIDMVGGFYGLTSLVPEEKLSLLPQSDDQVRFYSLIIVFMLPYMNPALVQRLLMSRNLKHVQRALYISSLGRMPYYIMVALLGLVALILNPSLQPDMAFPYLVNNILPIGLKGLVIAGVFAVIMSTADSFLHVTGLLFTHDVMRPLFNNSLSEKTELLLTRIVTFVIGVASVVGALSNTNIIELNILAYAFWLPGIMVPLISAVLGYTGTLKSFLISASCGVITYLLWLMLFFEQTNIDSLLPAVIVSAISFLFMNAMGNFKPLKKNLYHRFLNAYRPAKDAIKRVYRHKPSEQINKLVEYLSIEAKKKVDSFGAPFYLFVIFTIANLCFIPFIFADTSGAELPAFIIYLQSSAALLSFILIMRDFWPQRFMKYQPLYWYFTVFFCLPFFVMVTCLFTSCAIEWVIDLMLTVFVLSILVDWKTYTWFLALSAILATMSFMLFGDVRQFDPSLGNFLIMAYALIVSFIAGAIFSRAREQMYVDKLVTFKALGGTIAHEMRTPLSSINISANGLKECLPILLDGYQKAKSEGLSVKEMPELKLQSVRSAPQRMDYICRSALNTIDMLLMQLKSNNYNDSLSTCSIVYCIDNALNEYPFRADEMKLINKDHVKDFTFLGNNLLVMHIIFNFLRNALFFIAAEKRGNIIIYTSETKEYHHLHFRDTSKGINRDYLPQIFNHGFSKRSGGSGVGLYYCQKMMHAMNGDITVDSVLGEYTEFKISFPKNVAHISSA